MRLIRNAIINIVKNSVSVGVNILLLLIGRILFDLAN